MAFEKVDVQRIAHLGTWEGDSIHPMVFWSDELYKILGITQDEFKPSFETYLTKVHPDDREQIKVAMTGALVEHTPYSQDERIIKPDGSVRYIHTWGSPELDQSGKLVRLVGICQDITDRKLAELALAELLHSQEFISKISKSLLASINLTATLEIISKTIVPEFASCCSINILGENDALQCLEVSFADEEVSVKVKRMRQQFIYDLATTTEISKILKTGKPELYANPSNQLLSELFPNHEVLELFPKQPLASAMLMPLLIRGKIRGIISFISFDPKLHYSAPDLQRAEELCNRAALAIDNAQLYQEAEKSIQLREEFMTIASHELTTPLTPLKLQLQLLSSYIKKMEGINNFPVTQSLVKMLDTSDKQVIRLQKLVENLLQVSQISSGKLILKNEQFDLIELVQDVLESFRPESVTLKCELNFHATTAVIGQWDRTRLEQVVTNLLSNAMKYGSGKPVNISVLKENNLAVINVQDFGIGISKQDQTRIFKKFEHAVSVTNYGGMGLGLYITKQIVEAHAGHIKVQSVPTEGSSFTVELPISVISV